MIKIKDLGSAIRIDDTFLQKCNIRIYIIGEKLAVKHNDKPILAEISYKKCLSMEVLLVTLMI